MVKCAVCGQEISGDEVCPLDCNGDCAPPEEMGGSGDVYGIVCNICHEERYDECLEVCHIKL